MKKRTCAAILSFLLLFGVLTFVCGCGDNTVQKEREDVVLNLANMTESVSVLSKSYYPDYRALSEKLMNIKYGLDNGILTDETISSEIESARRELEDLGYYYDYEGKTAVLSEDGTVYGAVANEGIALGGGIGYPQEFNASSGYIVEDDNDFYYIAGIAKAGDVMYISANAVIDLSDLKITNFPELTIPDGVTIASARGYSGLGGGVLKLSVESAKMFSASSNVRITGVVIEGPDATTHDGVDNYTESNGIVLNGIGIEIDNCEISGFSGAGIIVSGGDAYIHDCYVHHIRGNNAGNGILVKGGSAKIERTLFSNCRNGVTVKENARIEASNNVEVGTCIESVFRIEGGAEAEIKNNTFLGYTAPILLSGTPAKYVVENNLFSLNDTQYGEKAIYGKADLKDALSSVVSIKNNVFNIKVPYLMTWGEEKPSKVVLSAPEVEAHPASTVDYGRKYVADIVTVGVFGSGYEVMDALNDFVEKTEKGKIEKAKEHLNEAISALCSSSSYYECKDELSKEIDGVIYGAYIEEGDSPIGGGIGYKEIITTGDYVVDTLDELLGALSKAKSGEVVFIEGHANIDVTSVKTLTLGAGVTLASNRGYVDENGDYSTGAVIWSSVEETSPVIQTGDNARVTGIVVDGKNYLRHLEHHKRCFSDAKYDIETAYYSLPMTTKTGIDVGNNTRVDNCEIMGFGYTGVLLGQGIRGVLVDHCYIHHNQTNGLGYGVVHSNDSESVIEYCLFNYNRHSIAASGGPVSGYIARYNVEMGESLEHCFDIHGGADRGDGTDIAGTYCEMYNNTFLITKEYPYYLRGVPEDYQIFYHNICAGERDTYSDDYLINERATLYDNIFAGVLVE